MQKDCIGVDGRDGTGKRLTPQQIKTALKINQVSTEREDDMDSIARSLGLPIDHIAQQIINLPSPDGTRQVVKKISQSILKPENYGPDIFSRIKSQRSGFS